MNLFDLPKVPYVFDIETNSLDPTSGQILAIGLIPVPKTHNDPLVLSGIDEKQLLEDFWNLMEHKTDHLVGYNSLSFDMPFLIARSLILNVPVATNLYTHSHTDLRRGLPRHGKLTGYAKAIGLEVTSQPGSHMKELYEQGKWADIKAHVSEDVLLTRELHHRAVKLGIVLDDQEDTK